MIDGGVVGFGARGRRAWGSEDWMNYGWLE
jgi:hypothetical protein